VETIISRKVSFTARYSGTNNISHLLTFLADKDIAAEVRKLTKKDVLNFYNTFLAPTSKDRAKVSIHLISQKKTETAVDMSADERLEKLTSALANHFTISGLPADQAQLKARLSTVELSSGNEDAITSSINSYLSDDAKVSKENVQKVLVDGKAQLTPLLASVGVEPATTSKDDNGKEVILQERTYITDLDELKRTLPKYPLLKPVKDLSEFEDSELKL
jgi:insulysin